MESLKRDKKYIEGLVSFKGGKVYCNEACIIEYPVYYHDKALANEGEDGSFYGVFALIVGDKYSVGVIPTLCESNPIDIRDVERKGVNYRQLLFGKGDCIISNTEVVGYNLKAFTFFESYFMRGRVPWYIDHMDLVKVMDNLNKYAGSKVGANKIVNELLVGFIVRDGRDPNIFYRQIGGVGEYQYVSLMDLYTSIRSTSNRLAGGYMNTALTSALVNPSKRNTRLDEHLKG